VEDWIMNGKRIATIAALLGLAGLAVTVLVAAREAGDRSPDSPGKAPSAKKLVCLGIVDAQEPIARILPDNFPQPATVTKVLVKEGEDVKDKQNLLEFDVSSLKLKVDQAESAIRVARAKRKEAELAVKNHPMQVKEAENLWLAARSKLEERQKQHTEMKRLFMSENKTRADLDAAESELQAAQYTLEASKAKLDGLKAADPSYLLEVADEGINQLENLKEQAQNALNQLSCKARGDGRIIRSFVHEGEVFGMHTREPAFWFLKTGPPIVRAEVTQEFARRVTKGQTAKIEDESDPQQVWRGKVEKVPDQFLPKRLGNTGLVDLMPVNDDRVLECQVSIELAPGETPPRYGQKVRVTLGE
jgi:multidrug efflux pump subunit AcrA (membrane-fusion protein)